MKIWIVANRPIGNDFWLKKSIEEKYPPNIEVGILAARKTATEFRKYGKFGWMAVQVIQFGIAAKAYRKSSDKDIIIATSFPV